MLVIASYPIGSRPSRWLQLGVLGGPESQPSRRAPAGHVRVRIVCILAGMHMNIHLSHAVSDIAGALSRKATWCAE